MPIHLKSFLTIECTLTVVAFVRMGVTPHCRMAASCESIEAWVVEFPKGTECLVYPGKFKVVCHVFYIWLD